MTNIPGYGIGTPPLREIFASKKTHAYWLAPWVGPQHGFKRLACLPRRRCVLSMTLNGWHDKLSGVMNRSVLLSVLGRDFKPPFYGRP